MRQILFGVWLALASSAITACDGEAFAPGANSEDEDSSGSSSGSKSGGAGRGSAGTSNTSGSGAGNGGGASSAGSSTIVLPGAGMTSSSGSSSGGTGMEPADQECAEGRVTFRMVPGADLPHDYVCDASCGTGWLTITDAEGASALSIFSACGTASCESCEILPCAAASCLPTSLTAEGTELSWSGTYLKDDACGANVACQRQSCVAPGKYKAKACANVNAGVNGMDDSCMPQDGMVLCTEAEFDFPSSGEVRLVLEKP